MKMARWCRQDGAGWEHSTLDVRPDGVLIESAAIGESGAVPFGLMYRIECDARWQATRLALRLAGGLALDLRREAGQDGGEHRWTDADGAPNETLRGCIDVDIAATPFTNTLPIRRLRLRPGERRVIRVAYVQVPTLAVSAVEQAYTCIEAGRRYRFEGLDTGFAADLTIDGDGLVLDYPGLFTRIA